MDGKLIVDVIDGLTATVSTVAHATVEDSAVDPDSTEGLVLAVYSLDVIFEGGWSSRSWSGGNP